MSNFHSYMFSQKVGKCPTIILTHFLKEEENGPLSFRNVFTKWRKMSPGYSDKFSKMEEKVHKWFDKISKKEENVHGLFLQIFNKGRKMSLGHSDMFSQKGGKCPTVIMTRFHNKEENFPLSF